MASRSLKARNRRIIALYKRGVSCANAGAPFGLRHAQVSAILEEAGIPRRQRRDEIPAVQRRNDMIVRLYRTGLSLHEVADRIGINWCSVQGILRRRGIPRRTPADRRLLLKDRDSRLVALYRRGLLLKEIAPLVGLTAGGVASAIQRLGVPRRARRRPDRADWDAVRRKIERVAYKYNTGRGTSATALARSVGVNRDSFLRYLKRMSVPVRKSAGSSDLTPSQVAAFKRDLCARRSSVPEAARRHGISARAARAIAIGHSWRHVPWPAGKTYSPLPTRVLDAPRVRKLKIELSRPGLSLVQLAEKYGASTSAIMSIARARTWRHVPWPTGKHYLPRLRGKPLRIDAETARLIKIELVKGELSFRQTGEKFGVSTHLVCSIAMESSWKHVPWPAGARYVRRPVGLRPLAQRMGGMVLGYKSLRESRRQGTRRGQPD